MEDCDFAMERGLFYGVTGFPNAIFNGKESILGGGSSTYTAYLNLYNQLMEESPTFDILTSLENSNENYLDLHLQIDALEDYQSENLNILYALIDFSNQVKPVFLSEPQPLSLSSGESEFFDYSIEIDENWNNEALKAVTLVQDMDNFAILGSDLTWVSSLEMDFEADITTGPSALTVKFSNKTFPEFCYDSIAWDLDNDGNWDSEELNPQWTYQDVGLYDVKLEISYKGETQQITKENFIEVIDSQSISGEVSGTWSEENGTYNITGPIYIPENASLTINPGTEIFLNEGVSITAYGNLNILGTEENKINLSSSTSWKGIKFLNNSTENRLENLYISDCLETAIYTDNSNLNIKNVVLQNNSSEDLAAAIAISNSSSITIKNSILNNNINLNSTGGIEIFDSNMLIQNSLIVNNSCGSSGVISIQENSDVTLINNTIFNNLHGNSTIFALNSDLTAVNNIIHGQETPVRVINGESNIFYNCLNDTYPGEGNFTALPNFVFPSDGIGTDFNGLDAEWTLESDSPCIDAGNPSTEFNDTDNTRNDIGFTGGPEANINITSEDDEVIVPELSHMKIYPNPFNPKTNISISLSKRESNKPISLLVYNIKGQLVKSLIENRVSNSQTISWDGLNNYGKAVSSGIYLIKLRTNNYNEIQKIMLLK